MDAVAETVHDITPGWLTRALQGAGHDYTVASVHHRAIGTGQMGCTYRLALDYDGPGGPPTLVVKLAAADESTRRLVSSAMRLKWASIYTWRLGYRSAPPSAGTARSVRRTPSSRFCSTT